MKRIRLSVMVCALALMVGCAQNKKKMAARPLQPMGESPAANAGNKPADAGNKPPADNELIPRAAAHAANALAGSWQLAIPRRALRQASITASDATHITISAGDTISGEYVVQGSYLLILTRDERLRPIAWKINSPDSLTLVRTPELGPRSILYQGITLFRAQDDATAGADMEELPVP
jgi:hypothetical protein